MFWILWAKILLCLLCCYLSFSRCRAPRTERFTPLTPRACLYSAWGNEEMLWTTCARAGAAPGSTRCPGRSGIQVGYQADMV